MIAIYGKSLSTSLAPYAQELFSYLDKTNTEYLVEKRFADLLRSELKLTIGGACYEDFETIRKELSVVVSMGGDGTILEAVTFVRESEIPILGINFGRLGFLANIGKEQLHLVVDALNEGTYLLDKRSLLAFESNKPLFDENFALNEMTIQRKDSSSMITIHAYINGEYLNSYWADGLIVSTPTGSTGYSLSCGGPIIYPTSGNFVITPVAPHNLNVRPMVVSDAEVLSFEVTGRGNSFLCSLDSRHETIDSSFQLTIRKANFCTNLVRLTDMNFLSALKNKLNWGVDTRNS